MAFWRRSNRNTDSNSAIVSAIPRYLHFTWGFFSDNSELPDVKKAVIRQWKRCNLQWQGEVHRPADLHVHADKWGRETYDNLVNCKQRCDVARVLLLSEYGGAYSELDLHPVHGMDALFRRYSKAQVLLLEIETLTKRQATQMGVQQPIRQGTPEQRLRIANYWMASAPYHPFWQDVLKLIHQRSSLALNCDYDVDYTTGADVITEVYHQNKSKYNDVVVVPKRIAAKYFVHDREGSWRGKVNSAVDSSVAAPAVLKQTG